MLTIVFTIITATVAIVVGVLGNWLIPPSWPKRTIAVVFGIAALIFLGLTAFTSTRNSDQHGEPGSSTGPHPSTEMPSSGATYGHTIAPSDTLTGTQTTPPPGQGPLPGSPGNSKRTDITPTSAATPEPRGSLGPQPNSDVPAAFLGHWSGTQYQDRDTPYSYQAQLTIANGRITENIGTADYSSLSCSFFLRLDHATSSSIDVTAAPASGNCIPPTMRFRISASNHLVYDMYNDKSEHVGGGDLTKAQA